MIQRNVKESILELAKQYSAIAVLGPRQSGKTTLVKALFPLHKYISFEDILGAQENASTDPKGFLEFHENEYGIILDEFQHVPTILSYIQLDVDTKKRPGYFILTGSQNFLLNAAITQTLAGRVALVELLPLSIGELDHAGLLPNQIEQAVYQGCYPRIYDESLNPTEWYSFYMRTYLERDVRQLKNVGDLRLFQKFVQLCAGRCGQILNVSALSTDCGINMATAEAWLSILQACYIIFLLQPHHKNFNKRIVKRPKLYFFDTGLACFLLGIESSSQLYTHYFRGALIETLIVADFFKQFFNRVRTPRVFFWCDQSKHEVDCIIEYQNSLIPVEIKGTKTLSKDLFDGIHYWGTLAHGDPLANFEPGPHKSFLIYTGAENEKRSYGTALSWRSVDEILKK